MAARSTVVAVVDHEPGLAAVPVLTSDGCEYIRDGELYFYLTRRLPGSQPRQHHLRR